MTIRVHPIFTAFSAGVWSPDLEGRIDLAEYTYSCKQIRNAIVKPQGGILGRGGFHYVAPAKYPDRLCRLVGFKYSDLQNYIIEIGHQYMRFYMDCGRIEIGDGSELITNGTFDSGITSWDDLSTGTGSIAWNSGVMRISGGSNGIGWAEQGITTVADTLYILKFDVITNPLRLRIGSTTGSDDILKDTVFGVATGQSIFFIAMSTTTYIQFRNPNDNNADLDNVSCQKSIPYEIETDYVEDDLDQLAFAQDDESLYIVHPLYPPAKLTRDGHTNWTWDYIEFIDGPYEDEINTPTITPSWVGPSVDKVTNGGFDTDTVWVKGANWTISDGTANKSAGGVSTLSQNTNEASGEVYMVTWTLVSISGGSLTMSIGGVSGTARSSPGTFTEFITATGTGDLTFTPSAAEVVCSIDNVSVYRMSVLTASASLFQSGHEGALWRIKHGTTWGYGIIEKYISETSAYMNVKKALGGTGASAGHMEGAWSEVNGYPRSVTFHEQRIVYASSPEHPQTVWASKTWNYNDFTPGTGDDDPYTFKVADANNIRWVSSGRGLLLGAKNGAFLAQASNENPISPTYPPMITHQSTKGAAKVQPLRVGKAIIYVQESGRKLIELSYTYELDSYADPDLSIRASNLFTDDIVEMAYQLEPYSILYALLLDGTLLGCTYDRSIKTVAWHEHFTDGYFESIATIPYLGEHQLWASIAREIDGNTVRYIEYLDWDIHQDSALTYSGAPTTTVRGLHHLKGKVVEIVGDGAVMPPQIVPSNGQLTLTNKASEIVIGLGYTPKIVSQRPEFQQAGTTVGLPRRWNKIMARVIETIGIKVNGKQIPARKPSDKMDQGPPPFTGVIDITNLGWDQDGYITIEQPLPLPMEIVCLTGTLVVGD